MTLHTYIYLTGLLLGTVVRVIYTRRYRREQWQERRDTRTDRLLLALIGVAMLLPLAAIFSDWLTFADYALPRWTLVPGGLLTIAFVWLLWRSHADLGDNWAKTLEIRQAHQLVSSGVYRRMRHPMYAAHLLWGLSLPFLIGNWLAAAPLFLTSWLLYRYRAPQEEAMMIDRFGEAYLAYRSRSGSIWPRG
ncbi:MAG: isoprenylcysteine carboxylmethyltransferase family protein [Bacteroidetes bacterium]|nr:MAG: isoprenylcysteine carboxylmethyltransferase family protein [Bacteroidota bacterium]